MSFSKVFMVLVLLAAIVGTPVSAAEINPEDRIVIWFGELSVDDLYDGCSSFMDEVRANLLAKQT